jgi:predicted permease
MNDLVSAVRSLRKAKAFSLATFLTLALCIGVNTALFGFVNTVLLTPLPVPEPKRVVYLVNGYPKAGLPRAGSGVPDYFDRRERMKTLEALALYSFRHSATGEAGRPERVGVMRVTPSYFDVTRVPPLMGRAFLEQEGEPDAAVTAVISYAYWHERYAGDPRILGAEIRIDDQPFTIVGVMGKGFRLVEPAEARIWVPLAFPAAAKSDANRHNNSWQSVGRLREGATLEQAQAEVDRINAADVERLTQWKQMMTGAGFQTLVLPLQEDMVRNVRGTMYFLWGATLLILLVGCANVANLTLVRSSGRIRDLATRFALGAGRGAMARLLLTESLLLTLAGGLAGLLLGWATLRLIGGFDLRQIPRADGLGLDPANVAFTMALTLLVGIAIGLFPLAATRSIHLASMLQDAARGSSSRRGRALRRGLVVVQVAVAFVLIIGSGLLLSSFRRVVAIDPGFDMTRILTASVSLPAARYVVRRGDDEPDVSRLIQFPDRVLERLRATPGVVNAGFSSAIPLTGGTSTNGIMAEGRPPLPGEPPTTAMRIQITPGYLESLRVPLKSGRYFDIRDTEGAPQVVIVDTRLAERLWPGEDPIGRRMCQGTPDRMDRRGWQTVVGLVEEIKQVGLVTDRPVPGTYYYPFAQYQALTMTLVVRTAGEPAAIAGALRDAVAAVDPMLPVFRVRTYEQVAGDSLLTRRWPMLTITTFGVVALLLAAIGLYGVVAYVVAQRSKEIGIRLALGATPYGIARLVAREGFVLTVAGLAGGALAAFALRRTVASQLYRVQAGDPAILVGAALVIGAIALLASAIPSLRAARIDPVVVLNRE